MNKFKLYQSVVIALTAIQEGKEEYSDIIAKDIRDVSIRFLKSRYDVDFYNYIRSVYSSYDFYKSLNLEVQS